MATTVRVKTKATSISLENELMDKVNKICETQGCSRSWLLTQALNVYFNELEEEKADYKLAMAAWKEHEESGDKAISSDEARKMLGL